MKKIDIILGDITYPKSESLIIPANLSGIMNRGVQKRIVKEGWKIIEKEAKENVKKGNLELGDYFVTEPGRLKRRGVKKIYHSIIKRFPSDFTSVNIVNKALLNVFRGVIKDKNSSVTICSIGTEPGELDKTIIAKIMIRICEKFKSEIKIKIMDEDEEFINDIRKYL